MLCWGSCTTGTVPRLRSGPQDPAWHQQQLCQLRHGQQDGRVTTAAAQGSEEEN